MRRGGSLIEPGEAVQRRALDRIGAFSDGVFAVAITLLVLNIEVPSVPADDLASALGDLAPDLTTYFIAFAVIGLFWYGHHVSWSFIERSSGSLVVVNLLLLSLIALMPFTTALMGSFDSDPLAVTVYAANVGLAMVVDSILDIVVLRQRLASVAKPAGEIRRDMIVRPLFFFGSIPLAYLIGVGVAQIFWIGVFVVPWALAFRRSRREPPAAA